MRRRENVPMQSDEACWGAPSFFSPHPVGVYKGTGTESELITQSAYLLVHKSSSQLYHSVITTYYSMLDTDCIKQYLVLLFDPGSGGWKRWKLLKIYSIHGKDLHNLLREKGIPSQVQL
eukprot:scaffold188828_cov47-Attheya_sp.AAC.1